MCRFVDCLHSKFLTSNATLMNSTQNDAKKKFPKIGKRGWTGVVVCGIGLLTLLGARHQAEELEDSTWKNIGFQRSVEDESLAKSLGYNSYSDYLTEQNQHSGLFAMAVGTGLIIWGYRKYNPTTKS